MNIDTITVRTFRLAQYFYRKLVALKYPAGQPVARIYSDTQFTSESTQGPVVTFNLLRRDGSVIGYSEVAFYDICMHQCNFYSKSWILFERVMAKLIYLIILRWNKSHIFTMSI
jgi:hypothetical protein